MTQVPHGPDNLYCPFWRKAQSKVCHTCPLWVKLRGMNRNTGEEVDQWQCSFSFLPPLLVEVAQQSRECGAAVESFRNQTVNQNTVVNRIVEIAMQRAEQRQIHHDNPAEPLLPLEDDNGAR